MSKKKVCVDIGGTKTIFAVLDGSLGTKNSVYIDTPGTLKEFLSVLHKNLEALESESDTANVSIAGRVDEDGKVTFCPNLPINGINLKTVVKKHFKKVYIDNDANCFAVYEIFKGFLKGKKNGIILVWGTGVGGSLVLCEKIYRGAGLASEMGHIKTMIEPGTDTERLIGGRWLKERFGYSGFEMHTLAEAGDVLALSKFKTVGEIFGRYLASLTYLLDPDMVIIGGSFTKSWKFMKDSINRTIKTETIRKRLEIKTTTDEFYVIKGCYFLDEYAKLDNKL